jgi:glutathione peroxidase
MPSSILDLTMPDIDGAARPLAGYRGRVLLIVNVASQCGNTPQYVALETLSREYRERGLSVLAFPCNDFGAQEPGSEAEIKTFCHDRYGVSFDLFSKIAVKGPGQHPLYAALTAAPGTEGEVTWNFAKFLVDRTGRVAARFTPKTDPRAPELIAKLEALLAA